MAKRPNVKDILEAARKAGAAKTSEESASAPEPEAVEPESPAEAVAAPEQQVAAEVPTAASLGRPLSLKEKLAAARTAGATKPVAAAAKPASAPAAEPAEEEAAPAAEPTEAAPAPPRPTGRPMTVAEKLAFARSGGAKPAAAPAGAKPAAPKAAAAAPKAAAARALPPLDKMTDPKDLAEAARQAAAKRAKDEAATKAAAAPAKAKPAPAKPQTVPPRPGRELAAAGAPAGPAVSRRGFFVGSFLVSWIAVAWVTFTAGLIAMTQMTVRFMFPNVLAEPPSTVKIGLASNFDPEGVSDRFKAEWGFWVVRSTVYNGQDVLYALQSICTHLGCPPNWLASEQKFKCPCHGSGFYISGINFEGPAPRPLERFKVAVSDDGQIVVDKSQRFQQELGQWSDPDSYIPA
jgi:cytochrome b6-f complex iron-sulfur subunit